VKGGLAGVGGQRDLDQWTQNRKENFL
jgi:hypothetical protein